MTEPRAVVTAADGALLVTDRDGHWYVGFRAAELIRYLAEHAAEINAGDVACLRFNYPTGDSVPKVNLERRLPPVSKRRTC